MPTARTHFSVGIFVIIGMAGVVVVILWLGMMQYFQEGRKYAAFFDESVQGLKKDSAVKYRGVDIGRVDEIRVAPDGRLVQIILSLHNTIVDPASLFARIESVGITGIMFVELERMKPGESIPPPELSFDPKHPVIVTKPSEMQKLFTDLYDITNQIKEINFKKVENEVSRTLGNVNQALTDARVAQISADLRNTLAAAEEVFAPQQWQPIRDNIQSATKGMDQLVDQTERSVEAAGKSLSVQNQELAESIEKFQTAVENATHMIASGSQLIDNTDRRMAHLHQQTSNSLRHLESVSLNLNRLIEELLHQPSRLLFSQPPQEKAPAKTRNEKGR